MQALMSTLDIGQSAVQAHLCSSQVSACYVAYLVDDLTYLQLWKQMQQVQDLCVLILMTSKMKACEVGALDVLKVGWISINSFQRKKGQRGRQLAELQERLQYVLVAIVVCAAIESQTGQVWGCHQGVELDGMLRKAMDPEAAQFGLQLQQVQELFVSDCVGMP